MIGMDQEKVLGEGREVRRDVFPLAAKSRSATLGILYCVSGEVVFELNQLDPVGVA